MAGVLLSAGPVATMKSVQRTSQAFLFSVTKSKFDTASQKLQAAGLGRFVEVNVARQGKSTTVFIKKTPEEISNGLMRPENADLCTLEQYVARYNLPPAAMIREKLQKKLIKLD